MSLLSLASCMVIFSITDNLRKSMLLKVNRFLNQESYLISFCIFKCILKNVNCLGKKYLQKKISVNKKGEKVEEWKHIHSVSLGCIRMKHYKVHPRERNKKYALKLQFSMFSIFWAKTQRFKDSWMWGWQAIRESKDLIIHMCLTWLEQLVETQWNVTKCNNALSRKCNEMWRGCQTIPPAGDGRMWVISGGVDGVALLALHIILKGIAMPIL